MRASILNPGILRDRITWQRKAETGYDSFGAPVEIWGDLVTCAARVRSLVGRELVAVTQIFAEARYKIEQHYYAGLKPTDRISWYVDGRVKTLDVIDIGDVEGTGRVQTIYAKDHEE